MSHVTVVRTRITDQAALEAAAQALGLEKSQVKIRQVKIRSKLVWNVPGTRHVVVAEKNTKEGTFDLSADWYEINWALFRGKESLSRKLQQEYSRQVILRRARLLGHQVVEERLPDGSIKLKVRV